MDSFIDKITTIIVLWNVMIHGFDHVFPLNIMLFNVYYCALICCQSVLKEAMV